MRAARPDEFSDSVEENENVLDRLMLEHQLSTLGDRRQEIPFENFSRRVCEKVICPNLMPHSGRDAGGDAKVDTETFPVSPKLSAAWYTGSPEGAGSDRWAFAFSTQTTWRAKVRGDAKKIVDTARGYSRIFFVSSEVIRDKDRADTEDTLRAELSVDVRIFDRTWLLDQVFGHKLEAVAIEELAISPMRSSRIRKGPNDTARERELEVLEERIRLALAESTKSANVASDAIEAAELARQMERPRPEVEGLFLRAHRLAREMGTPHQQLVALYQYAWTTYWYYEDFTTFGVLYAQVEALAIDTINMHELTLLHTLWTMLRSAVSQKHIGKVESQLVDRTLVLRRELERIKVDRTRMSASLEAKTCLVFMDLLTSGDAAGASSAIAALRDIALAADNLVGYPLKRLAKLVSDLGDGPALPGYEGLHETIVTITIKRDGEVAGGTLLLRRGLQQLQRGDWYDAIRTLGRTLSQLHKHETRRALTRALICCSSAYEHIDLLWAARGTVLTAAGLAIHEFWNREKITIEQAHCFNRMKWLEVRMGRLPQALAWHELDRAARSSLVARGDDADELAEGDDQFDSIIGRLFLTAEPTALQAMTRLPDALEALGLHSARIALLYALGHEDEIVQAISELEGRPTAAEYFTRWRDQPSDASLSDKLLLSNESKVRLAATVLGCRITCIADNIAPCTETAESLLAVLEALLATGFQDGIVAHEPELIIEVIRGDVPDNAPFAFVFREEDSVPHLEVTCGDFDPHRMAPELQTRVRKGLSDFLPEVLARTFVVSDVETTMTKLFRDDRANDRAVNFTSSFVVLGSVMGDGAALTLANWVKDGSEYPLRRARRWDSLLPAAPPPRVERESQPAASLDQTRTAHGDIQMVSPIRRALWDKAQWAGAAFAVPAALDELPVLAFMFRDQDAALKIFSTLRTDLGVRDDKKQLRVSIIRGIDAAHPTWYRILVGSNTDTLTPRPGGFVITSTRCQTLTPDTTENLDRFLARYERTQKYVLMPAIVDDSSKPAELHPEVSILKVDLVLRNAWEIGRHDPDMSAILEDDQPVLPSRDEPAPVLELIAWKKRATR
jgi:hypothetical protein